jgi:LmbE family N-acetylglucosaminyl deacetylase
MRIAIGLLFITVVFAQERRLLVVTASSGDYIFGAGGTIARFIRDGWRADVVQFGNDEKESLGLTQAQTRLASVQEGRAAAKLLGVTDVILMDHKSGELGYVSTTEMRNQLFALIRGLKPDIIFIPDPYVHYQDNQDVVIVGRMAEEAWGYSGGAMFGNELTRMGFKPYGAPEVFYYSPFRPYRRGEGGSGRSRFVAIDITETLEHKLGALELLMTRNRRWVAGRAGLRNDRDVNRFVRAFAQEMAETIGAKHRLAVAEEFNHVGPPR